MACGGSLLWSCRRLHHHTLLNKARTLLSSQVDLQTRSRPQSSHLTKSKHKLLQKAETDGGLAGNRDNISKIIPKKSSLVSENTQSMRHVKTRKRNFRSRKLLNEGTEVMAGDTSGSEQRDVKIVRMRQQRRSSCTEIDEVAAESMLLYKDDDLIALNKPSGMAVHSGPKMRNDLSQYLHFWQYEEDQLPELAHRLDKDTSGVLLLTRHKEAARRLAEMFKQRQIIKTYWAVTVNVPDQLEGTIRIPLSTKNIGSSGRMNRVVLRADKTSSFSASDRGRTLSSGVHMAETQYRVLSVHPTALKKCCLMEVNPVTGFKHQIRVHLADGLMCPILGDHKFAGPIFRSSPLLKKKVEAMDGSKSSSLHLHAREVVVPNYFEVKGKPLVINAPPPGYFVKTIRTQKLSMKY